MSNEIQISSADANGTVYAIVQLTANSQYWNGTTLENYNASNWTKYAISFTIDSTTNLYQASFPPAPNGLYNVLIYSQAGMTPATSDTKILAGPYEQEATIQIANNDIEFCASEYTGSNPLYFITWQVGTDLYWNSTTQTPEVQNINNWKSYAIPMALVGTNYIGSMPTLPDGPWFITIFEQPTSQPATTDIPLADGEYPNEIEAPLFASQMMLDALAFISDFAEPITYLCYSDANVLLNTLEINAVVERNPPAIIQEDGKSLADFMQISVINDPANIIGPKFVNYGRDKIIVSNRFGGLPRPHLVSGIINQDASIINLKVR